MQRSLQDRQRAAQTLLARARRLHSAGDLFQAGAAVRRSQHLLETETDSESLVIRSRGAYHEAFLWLDRDELDLAVGAANSAARLARECAGGKPPDAVAANLEERARFARARAYEAQGDYPRAKLVYEELLFATPRPGSLRVSLLVEARFLACAVKSGEQTDWRSTALSLNPPNLERLSRSSRASRALLARWLSIAAAKEGELDEARDFLAEPVRFFRPESRDFLVTAFAIAHLCHCQGKPASARESFLIGARGAQRAGLRRVLRIAEQALWPFGEPPRY